MSQEDELLMNMGNCCACQRDNKPRNMMCLSYRTPYGHGWECFQCGLPDEGAVAAICDECVEANKKPLEFIKGYALSRERAPLAELTEPFEHDLSQHSETWMSEEFEICPNCNGTGVDGYEGNPDEDLSDQWNDKRCISCEGTGYV